MTAGAPLRLVRNQAPEEPRAKRLLPADFFSRRNTPLPEPVNGFYRRGDVQGYIGNKYNCPAALEDKRETERAGRGELVGIPMLQPVSKDVLYVLPDGRTVPAAPEKLVSNAVHNYELAGDLPPHPGISEDMLAKVMGAVAALGERASNRAIAACARCSVRSVQTVVKWVRENGLGDRWRLDRERDRGPLVYEDILDFHDRRPVTLVYVATADFLRTHTLEQVLARCADPLPLDGRAPLSAVERFAPLTGAANAPEKGPREGTKPRKKRPADGAPRGETRGSSRGSLLPMAGDSPLPPTIPSDVRGDMPEGYEGLPKALRLLADEAAKADFPNKPPAKDLLIDPFDVIAIGAQHPKLLPDGVIEVVEDLTKKIERFRLGLAGGTYPTGDKQTPWRRELLLGRLRRWMAPKEEGKAIGRRERQAKAVKASGGALVAGINKIAEQYAPAEESPDLDDDDALPGDWEGGEDEGQEPLSGGTSSGGEEAPSAPSARTPTSTRVPVEGCAVAAPLVLAPTGNAIFDAAAAAARAIDPERFDAFARMAAFGKLAGAHLSLLAINDFVPDLCAHAITLLTTQIEQCAGGRVRVSWAYQKALEPLLQPADIAARGPP